MLTLIVYTLPSTLPSAGSLRAWWPCPVRYVQVRLELRSNCSHTTEPADQSGFPALTTAKTHATVTLAMLLMFRPFRGRWRPRRLRQGRSSVPRVPVAPLGVARPAAPRRGDHRPRSALALQGVVDGLAAAGLRITSARGAIVDAGLARVRAVGRRAADARIDGAQRSTIGAAPRGAGAIAGKVAVGRAVAALDGNVRLTGQ